MASQQFCLKWNNHTNNMLNVFDNLLSTEALVDVTLACDGLSLKAHKMVLSACSPFFQSLFLENPCKHPIVIMKDMNYKDLKAIVDFMYRGEVNVSQDQLSALLKTAETLKVKGLAEVSGENRQASGVVQQEISTPQQNSTAPIPTSSSTPQQPPQPQQRRADSPPIHGKRKRGRPRKRSLSDSNRSDDEMVPTKIKEPDSPEIEELSGDASMEASGGDRQGSNSSQGPMHSSVNSFSSKHPHSNAQVEEPPSGEENEFEVEPSKLLEQTLTTDNVPPMSNAASSSTISSGNFNLPSSSGLEISQISMSGDNQALVPVSGTSDSLSSSHLQGPDSPQDIKPAILTFEEPPISPVAGTSQSMVYMDQSSLPGPSNYQDNSLVQHDAQPQDVNEVQGYQCEICSQMFSTIGASMRHMRLHRRDDPKSPGKYRCDSCNYSTDKSTNLNSHYRIHTGERPHKCEQCQKEFAHLSSLTRHKRIHSDELPFTCMFCAKKFRDSSVLSRHKRVHFGEKPYMCRYCGKTFTNSTTLKVHEAGHEPLPELPSS